MNNLCRWKYDNRIELNNCDTIIYKRDFGPEEHYNIQEKGKIANIKQFLFSLDVQLCINV